jgi:beta-galactosidase
MNGKPTSVIYRISLLALLVVLISAGAYARTKTSLNLGWKFHRADVADAHRNNFNDTAWQRTNLPHTWNVEDPWDDEPGYYRGAGWYRRELSIANLTGKRFFLYFEGANQVADVYVNGTKVGAHIGGYSAFAFDVTDAARRGKNIIAARVDNSFSEDIPPLTADFNFYGGIYRDVWLITADDVHFDVTDHASSGVRITTPAIAAGDGSVSVEGTVANTSSRRRTVEVVSIVRDHAKRKVAETSSRIDIDTRGSGKFSHTARIDAPRLWSTDSPYLYTVTNVIRESGRPVDEIVQPLGFRWFSFDGEKGFSLNGKPLRLRGTNRHQDYLGLGNAVPDRLHVRDMQIIKDAGFNFVRLAHYPQDPSVLEACDRLGLLVWEETPLVNYITKSVAFAENSERMVREMIRQHRNHPSVILWGYMNEIFLRVPNGRDDLYPATVELAKVLNRVAKEEDPTRPTTIAFHGNDVYNRTGLGDIPDVIGWNLYQGWYSATVEDFGKFLDDQHRRFPLRPLIVSEYGANGDQRLHSNAPRRFDSTIDYQRFFHESYVAQMEARPYLAGSAIWNQFDFGSEYRGETIPHLNQKGMYTFDRRPKDIHYFYKAKLSKQNVLHIAVRDHPKRSGVPGTSDRIAIFSNLSSIELFLNGRSLGTKPFNNSRHLTWEIDWKAGPNVLTARARNGKNIATDSATVMFTPVTAASGEIAINVGSNADFVDVDGRIWMADRIYRRGSWGYTGENAKRIFSSPPDPNILGTESDPLFQTQVEGLNEYRMDLPDGGYTVELLFTERRFEELGKRVFSVAVNGSTILDRLDLAKSVGRNRAFSKKLDAQVQGGLSIKFDAHVGQAILSGILVRRKY